MEWKEFNLDVTMQNCLDYSGLFTQSTVSGVNNCVSQSAEPTELLNHLQAVLTEKKPHILLSKPTNLLLTSGISEKGDLWSFEVLTPDSKKPKLTASKFYTMKHGGQVFNLADRRLKLPFYSIVKRRRNPEKGERKHSTIICLPPLLCRKFSALYDSGLANLDLMLEDFVCSVLSSFMASLDPQSPKDVAGKGSAGKLIISHSNGMELFH